MSFVRRAHRADGGFTFMEVVLAIAILAILVAMLAETFSHTVRALEDMEQDRDRGLVARTTLDFLGKDVFETICRFFDEPESFGR